MAGWREFLEERNKKSTPPQRFKLVLVGQEGAGKTTLLKSLRTKNGKVDVKENLSTDGIDEQVLRFPAVFKKKQALQPQISIQCFDFAGQEIYYPSHELFMSRRCIFLVVCSARDLLDSRARALARARYWLQKVQAFIGSSRAPVLLVFTRWDLVGRKERAQLFGSLSTADFLEGLTLSFRGPMTVSCKSGEGIDEVRKSIEAVARDPQFYPDIPEYTVQVEARLRTLTADQFGRIPVAEAEALGDDFMRTQTALEYLKATGAILHFEGTRERPETACYIVRPIALADLFKDILTFRHKFVRNGELSQTELFSQIWKSKDADWVAAKKDPLREKSILVDVLEQFELVVRSSEGGKLLVPSLLPEEVSPWYGEFWGAKAQQIGRNIELKSVLKGFFPKILHRCFHLGSRVETAWRSGVLLSWREALGSVVMNGMKLSISVQYEDGKSGIILFGQLLSVVESVFESYLHDWQRLRMTIPFHSTEIEYARCVERFQKGERIILLGSDQVSLDLLIPDVTLAHLTKIPPGQLSLGRILGEGGFGVVYLAQWQGKEVAVKVMKNKGEGGLSLIRDFTREAEVMSRLEHPCLVRLLGLAEVEDWPLPGIVMELVGGGTLAEDFHYPEPKLDALKRMKLSLDRTGTLLAGSADQVKEELWALRQDLFDELVAQQWSEQSISAVQNQVVIQSNKIRSELAEKMLDSDRRIPFTVRLRLLLDVALALEFLHGLSPPFVHNDVRSPNVFLLQIQRWQSPVAKLADYGLTRVAAGALKMGIDSWQWVAPEALDYRHAATFTVQADIYSFGIVCWEVLNGAGINIPYVEYESQFRSLADTKDAIRERGLRPTLSRYAEELFAAEPMYGELKALMSRCLQSNPSDRPPAAEACYELKKMLGIPAQPPKPIRRSPELSLVRDRCLDLALLRSLARTCSGCGRINESEVCQCGRSRPTLRVMSMLWHGVPWLGLKNGTLVQLIGEKPVAYAFTREAPVLALCAAGDGVWAATSTELMYVEAGVSNQVNIDPVGIVVDLVRSKAGVWLLQAANEETIATTYSFGLTRTGSLTIPLPLRRACADHDTVVMIGEASALLYNNGERVSEIGFAKKINPTSAWIGEGKICIATAVEVVQYSLAGQLLHRVEVQTNIRSVCGAWIGTLDGVHSRDGRIAGHGEMCCLREADGLLWAVDNTARLLCAYKIVVPATF